MKGVVIDSTRNLLVGDVLVEWGGDAQIFADVVAVDGAAREVRVKHRATGELVTWHTDHARTRGHTKIKRLRRLGEVLDWERGTAFERSIAYHEEAPQPPIVGAIREAYAGAPS